MTDESLERRLREIEDREAIRELPLRYCDCVWRRDADGVGALYTEDGRFDLGLDSGPIEGRAAISAFLRQSFSEGGPWPFIHNHVFDINGDRARGRCSFEVRAGDFISFGFYEDEYAREGAKWRFRSRKAVLLGAARSGDG